MLVFENSVKLLIIICIWSLKVFILLHIYDKMLKNYPEGVETIMKRRIMHEA